MTYSTSGFGRYTHERRDQMLGKDLGSSNEDYGDILYLILKNVRFYVLYTLWFLGIPPKRTLVATLQELQRDLLGEVGETLPEGEGRGLRREAGRDRECETL